MRVGSVKLGSRDASSVLAKTVLEKHFYCLDRFGCVLSLGSDLKPGALARSECDQVGDAASVHPILATDQSDCRFEFCDRAGERRRGAEMKAESVRDFNGRLALGHTSRIRVRCRGVNGPNHASRRAIPPLRSKRFAPVGMTGTELAAVAGAAALRTRLRFAHVDLAAFEVGAIESFDGSIGFRLGGHVDEGEAFRLSAEFVLYDFNGRDLAVRAECITQ